MKNKYAQGIYTINNPEKYVGTKPPFARSSWEFAFMRMCDNHPSITKWSSESVKIPYFNPITNKYANYVPDFLMEYVDKNGKLHVELIEVKPSTQSTLEEAKSKRDRTSAMLNAAKWTAAQEWCQRKGVRFRVITENDIFRNPGRRKKR